MHPLFFTCMHILHVGFSKSHLYLYLVNESVSECVLLFSSIQNTFDLTHQIIKRISTWKYHFLQCTCSDLSCTKVLIDEEIHLVIYQYWVVYMQCTRKHLYVVESITLLEITIKHSVDRGQTEDWPVDQL